MKGKGACGDFFPRPQAFPGARVLVDEFQISNRHCQQIDCSIVRFVACATLGLVLVTRLAQAAGSGCWMLTSLRGTKSEHES